MKKTLFLLFLLLNALSLQASGPDLEASLISGLNTAISKNKKIDIYFKLIDFYNKQNDNKKIIGTYKSIIDLYPNKKITYEALVSLGKTQVMEKQYADAIESFKEAVDLKPKIEEARLNLADVYDLNDLNNLAQAQYIAVLKRNKRSFNANSGIARLYLKLGFNSKASYYYGQALKIKPDYDEFREISICYERTGDIDSAITMLCEAVAKNESYSDMINLGRLYSQKNLDAYSEDQYFKAVKLNPDKPDAYVYLGLLNLKTDNIDKALGFLNSAKIRSTDDVSIHFILSYAYYLKKDIKMTNEELRLAKEKTKDNLTTESYVDKFQKFLLEEKIKSNVGNGLYFKR